jgi:hypothetical protein
LREQLRQLASQKIENGVPCRKHNRQHKLKIVMTMSTLITRVPVAMRKTRTATEAERKIKTWRRHNY